MQKAAGTPVAIMGSGALSVFGLCFLGMAAWVWIRSNRA
jgi:cbb3-type cytochrome oxidase subunit 3